MNESYIFDNNSGDIMEYGIQVVIPKDNVNETFMLTEDCSKI